MLLVQQADANSQSVYNKLWEQARFDQDDKRLATVDRHRNRTGWFVEAPEPLWKAPLEGPPVIVFYSFKGGLGRSTLLASFAIQRSRAGERVCVLDFDLDSPGVGRLLSADSMGLTARWGVVDYLLEYMQAGTSLADYYHRCDRIADVGEVVVFPAGRLDDTYAEKLARVDFDQAEPATGGGISNVLARARAELKPAWILVDARTGISEPAGQLLSGVAHLHVLLGTSQDQSWQGLSRILDRLGKERVLANRPQAEVCLVQAMVPEVQSAGKLARDAFAGRAEQEFADRYYAESDEVNGGDDRFWDIKDMDSLEAPHVAIPVEYNAKLASFGDIAEVADALCAGPYATVAERIISRFEVELEE